MHGGIRTHQWRVAARRSQRGPAAPLGALNRLWAYRPSASSVRWSSFPSDDIILLFGPTPGSWDVRSVVNSSRHPQSRMRVRLNHLLSVSASHSVRRGDEGVKVDWLSPMHGVGSV